MEAGGGARTSRRRVNLERELRQALPPGWIPAVSPTPSIFSLHSYPLSFGRPKVDVTQTNPAGGPPTFQELYADNESRVHSLLWAFGVAEHERADASQEVWLHVHRSLHRFDPRTSTARVWIVGIARNLARDWKRTRRRRPEFGTPLDKEPSTADTAETDAVRAERSAALTSYIERAIPAPEQREALLLHVVCGLTIEEVAAATNVRACTVRWRIAMARRKAKEALTEEERSKLLAVIPVISVDPVLQAMRETKVPADESARVWDRIKAQIETEGGSIHDRIGPTAPTPSALPKGYTFTGPRLAGGALAVFLLGAASGGAAVYSLLFPPARVSTTARIEADTSPALAEAPEPKTEPTTAPTSAPSTPVTTQPTTSPTASAAPPASPGRNAESALLNRARTAPASEALALAERHARSFPHSARAMVREEIAIRALLSLGRHAEAEARAARLVKWAPTQRLAMEALLGRSPL